MLNKLIERQDAIDAEIKKYTPTRELFEEFLKAGQREDAGFLWRISPGGRYSRYNWKRQEAVTGPNGRKVVVKASTDSCRYKFGYTADDVKNALIGLKVSLPENPDVAQELELPPVWAILEQPSDFSPLDLDKLGEELEEIVPLVRALLPQS